jgi:UDP-N-acetylglucosamine 2-epimerase (non-hydrolysing)
MGVQKPKIFIIAGARPNFVKVAPLIHELAKTGRFDTKLVHTGQHYDHNMSEIFFRQLQIPAPDVNLEVGSGTIAFQLGEIIKRFDDLVANERPDRIVLVGDVNSTAACALVAAHRGVNVAHVEAGLRSFDRTMPEEINRIVTDSLSDMFFVTEPSAADNLRREGVRESSIFFVGNVMIDTLFRFLPMVRERHFLDEIGLAGHTPPKYAVVTLHRAANVDDDDVLKMLLGALQRIGDRIPIIFPTHPRTQQRIRAMGVAGEFGALARGHQPGIHFCDPLGYIEFLSLLQQATVVLTDSGGIQEETTALGIPCLTLRENTERPVTVAVGTNVLVGSQPGAVIEETLKVLGGEHKAGKVPELWDGNASSRIVKILEQSLLG